MQLDQRRLHDASYRWEVVETLMREYAPAIAQYCTAWLGKSVAAEVTQEVFVTAWETLPAYCPKAPFRHWLLGIARHKCQQGFRNRARRQAIARTFLADIRQQAHTEPPSTPEEMLTAALQQSRLYSSLAQLREMERRLLVLRYWKGLPVAEIALMVGKSEAAVHKQLGRARQHLRQQLEPVTNTRMDTARGVVTDAWHGAVMFYT